jgi:single-strand DNA-binding protein
MYAMKNKVQLIGNLGQAPEVKTTETGKKLAQFSVATNESYQNAQGEKVTETQWHQVKGKEVAIEGKLVNRNYTDKQGVKHYVTEVVASDLLMLGPNKTAQAE